MKRCVPAGGHQNPGFGRHPLPVKAKMNCEAHSRKHMGPSAQDLQQVYLSKAMGMYRSFTTCSTQLTEATSLPGLPQNPRNRVKLRLYTLPDGKLLRISASHEFVATVTLKSSSISIYQTRNTGGQKHFRSYYVRASVLEPACRKFILSSTRVL